MNMSLPPCDFKGLQTMLYLKYATEERILAAQKEAQGKLNSTAKSEGEQIDKITVELQRTKDPAKQKELTAKVTELKTQAQDKVNAFKASQEMQDLENGIRTLSASKETYTHGVNFSLSLLNRAPEQQSDADFNLAA